MTPGWRWFFAWVGLAAFVLAIPMAICANLATPKVRHWWGTTSNARRTRRIMALKAQLFRYMSFDTDAWDDTLSLGLRYFALAFLCAVVFFLYALLPPLITALQWPAPVPAGKWFKTFLFLTMAVLQVGLMGIFLRGKSFPRGSIALV